MTGSKIFVDTAPFIYALEDNAQFSVSVRKAFSDYYNNAIPLCTSLLTFTEYCVIPYRQNDIRKITDFENFISDADIFVIPFTEPIAKYAAQIRAKYTGIKAMDALQLAFAIHNGCDTFLTNDKQLRQVGEIRIVLIDELMQEKGLK